MDHTPSQNLIEPKGLSGKSVTRQTRISSLDGLRGVSALLVLFHHILLTQPDFANFEWSFDQAPPHNFVEWLFFETPLRLSWAGQQRAVLFFVLSGFVLSLPWLAGKPLPYKKFLVGRFCRLYPPYIITMALAAFGAYLLGGKPIASASIWFNQLGWAFTLPWRALPSVTLLLNNTSSNWLDESVWSLVWEARVVIIFPAIIWAIVRWKNPGLIIIVLALLIAQPALGFAVPGDLAAKIGHISSVFLYPEYFVLGAAIALNRERISALMKIGRGGLGVVFLGVGLWFFWVQWSVQNGHADGVGAAFILAASLASPIVAGWLQARFLTWLGRLSYSLYLIHVPIILVTVILFHGTVPVLMCAAMIPLCIVLAELCRRYIEIPSVLLARRWLEPAHTTVAQPQINAELSR